MIADKQSHRAVWRCGGGHADQTRQEDHRWVCHSALLLLGAGADDCVGRVLSHAGGETHIHSAPLVWSYLSPSPCFPPQTSSLSWRGSPTVPSTSTPWWSSSPGAGTTAGFCHLACPPLENNCWRCSFLCAQSFPLAESGHGFSAAREDAVWDLVQGGEDQWWWMTLTE